MNTWIKYQETASWIAATRRSGKTALTTPRRVFFPPAGAGLFPEWNNFLPNFDLIPGQLPGREERFVESPPRVVGSIAEHLANALGDEQGREIQHALASVTPQAGVPA